MSLDPWQPLANFYSGELNSAGFHPGDVQEENVGDIYNLSITLSEQHGLPFGHVTHDTGYVFTPKRLALEGELPLGFTHPS